MSSINWDTIKAFAAIAERGSLSHAAKALGVSGATLGRKIDELERGLEIKLVKRSSQGASLTAEGLRVLELIKPGAERFDELTRLARSLAEESGKPPVRISSTEPMVADILAPRVPKLYAEHPGLRIELETSLELSNLNRGDCDVAVRMVRPEGETLITKKLPAIQMRLFASRSYLRRQRASCAASDLDLLWYDSAYGDIAENVWLRQAGLAQSVIFRAGSVRALAGAAAAGLGAAPLPSFIARGFDLVPLPDVTLPERSPWLVFHRDAKNDASSKAVRSWIEASVREALQDAQ